MIFHKRGVEEILNLQPRECSESLSSQAGAEGHPSISAHHPVTMRYELIIYWSKEDQCFLVEVPELAGCMADGGSYEEAVANAQMVIAEWIETARSLQRPIPEPKGKLSLA